MTNTVEEIESPPERLGAVPRLHDIGGCRRLMARVIREMYKDERNSLEGYRLVHALYSLSRVIEGADLESRVEEVEKILADQKAQEVSNAAA